MQRDTATLSKILIALIPIAALALYFFGLPEIVREETAKQRPGTAYLLYLFALYLFVLSIPFLVGMYQVFKLSNYINEKRAYSESSAGALRYIKYCGITLCALILSGIIALMVLSSGTGEDITGIVAPALLITLLSGVVATAAAVFEKRVQKATHQDAKLKPE